MLKGKGLMPPPWIAFPEIERYSIVLNGNSLKFTQNPGLRDYLLSAGDNVLAEASPYDGVWGIKMGQEDGNISACIQWSFRAVNWRAAG